MSANLPKVVIVGRPNVGKSSLLNLIAGRTISIVDPTAGVTRDRVSAYLTLPPPGDQPRGTPGLDLELIDTGGYGIEDAQARELSAEVERQIAFGLGEADLILFVLDAQSGLNPLDEEVAELLRRGGRIGATGGLDPRRVMLVANKVDAEKHEAAAYELMTLGFGEPWMVSATTKHGYHDLLEGVYRRLHELGVDPQHAALAAADADGQQAGLGHGPLLAIVGKRNAGKSTLVNALAGSERVIVSEIQGTTRDSIDVRFSIDDHEFTAIDTAGVRKRKSVKGDIDFYSYHRSLRSVRRAGVVLFLIDATVPISQVDQQLGAEVLKHHKPTVIVVNKWDLAEQQHEKEEYIEYLDRSLRGLDFAPIAFISAAQQEGVRDVVAMAMNLHAQAGHRVGTGELNRLIERIMTERGPVSKNGKAGKVFYVTQSDVRPPTIQIFVNDPDIFDHNFERFLLNQFHDCLPFSEVPIKLRIRSRSRTPREAL